MEIRKMGELYKKIANKVNDLIPVEWNEVYLYAEVIENDSSHVYFYFNQMNNKEFIYCLYIPKIYNINERDFKMEILELNDYFVELHKEYKENNPMVWTNLTMHLNSSGKFKLDFDYTDIISSKLMISEMKALWKYKNLGVYPVDEDEKKLVDEYIKSHS